MVNMARKDVVPALVAGIDIKQEIRAHMALLGHEGLGVTELRVFDPFPQVAYADRVDAVVRLCRQMDGRATGVYVGVQARPAHLFDLAPNRWVRAGGGPTGNCARDEDIEWISALFFDIDVVSPLHQKGHPASEDELEETLRAAECLARQDGLALGRAVCCSGNGHYVLAPVVPIAVDSEHIARKFRCFCQRLADIVTGQVPGARIDPVYNVSRVMRVMGTLNRKGKPLPDRPHRRAHFVTEPMPARSMALHHMILNTEVDQVGQTDGDLPPGLKCSLAAIEKCEFIQWCRRNARGVSEPQWFALITNLAHLEGGIDLIHQISALDPLRYDRAHTQHVIDRVLDEGYKPVNCRTIMSPAMVQPGRGAFYCSRVLRCPAGAPMYLAASGAFPTEEGAIPMNERTGNKPVKVFRCGCIKAAIWLNHRVVDDAVAPVYSVRITKSYKQKDGQWKHTATLAVEDLPKAALLAVESYRFLRMRSEEPVKSTDDQETVNDSGSVCGDQNQPGTCPKPQSE